MTSFVPRSSSLDCGSSEKSVESMIFSPGERWVNSKSYAALFRILAAHPLPLGRDGGPGERKSFTSQESRKCMATKKSTKKRSAAKKSTSSASTKKRGRKKSGSSRSPGILSKAKKVAGEVLTGAVTGAAAGAMVGAAEAGSKAAGVGQSTKKTSKGTKKSSKQSERRR